MEARVDSKRSRTSEAPPGPYRTLEEVEWSTRRVLLRADPATLAGTLAVRDGTSPNIPSTLQYLLRAGARVIVATHLDEWTRRAGYADLMQLGEALSESLRLDVLMPDECIGEAAELVVHELREGQLCLLPDLAAHPGETASDESFSRDLAKLADGYVGDALAIADRNWASVQRLPGLVRDSVVGLESSRTLAAFKNFQGTTRRKRLAVVGGPNFEHLAESVQKLLPQIGALHASGTLGAMLCAAAGRPPRSEVTDSSRLPQARSLLRVIREQGVELVLPRDSVAPSPGSSTAGAPDLGAESKSELAERLSQCEALLWWDDTAAHGQTFSTVFGAMAQVPATLCLGVNLQAQVLEGLSGASSGIAPTFCANPDVAFLLLSGRAPRGLDALRTAGQRQRGATSTR